MHIRCKTDHAIFLLGAFDARQVLRFPDEGRKHGGLFVDVDTGLVIDPQLLARVQDYLERDIDAKAVTIYQEFAEVVELPDLGLATVYLGQIDADFLTADDAWVSFPEIIRRLPKDRTRLPYLKAWQVLTGGLKLDTRAIENADLAKLLGGDD